MRLALLPAALTLAALALARPASAQLPFYTDDPAVTERGVVHFEFYNEYDALQSAQYPDLRQNTANYKINYGLAHHLELDLDFPLLAILRTAGTPGSTGFGDTDMGVKWEFRQASPDSHLPALAASLYLEFPTGSVRRQLGSGLTDYWLNFITQEPLTAKTHLNTNLGFLFAGNTSTGVVGIRTTRGHVFTGGLSVLREIDPRLTVGAEVYGGIADNDALGRSQLQAMLGGQYGFRRGMTLDFGVLGGKYVASPRLGAQIGFSMDLPDAIRRRKPAESRQRQAAPPLDQDALRAL